MQKVFKIPVLLLLFIAIFSCNDTKVKQTPEPEIKATQIDTISDIEEIVEEIDTITYDTDYYPIDTLLTTKILIESTFHEDEIDESFLNKEWFALVKNKKEYQLTETKLIAKRIHDVVLDESEKDKTGWKITISSKDTSLLLIEAQPYLSERKIQNYNLPEYIYPQDTVAFSYQNKAYKLFATGGKRKETESSDWYIVWNYKLYLTTTVNGKEVTELLLSSPQFDDTMVRILFAGDIDGDEKLDLILDTSSHYNASSPTLYLSKPAEEENKIIKPVGIHTSVGC